MAWLLANNYATTTTADISDVAVTLPVTSVTGLPAIGGADFCHLTIQQGSNIEIVKATAVSALNITIERALEGTTALAFTTGAVVSLRPTAALFDNIGEGGGASFATVFMLMGA